MAWKIDKPLYSLSDEQQNNAATKLWEDEKMGGVGVLNGRLPVPIIFLIGVVIVTAFLITNPLWGQRPTAEIYAPYVQMMDSQAVQSIESDEKKMAYLRDNAQDPRLKSEQARHPITMDDLRLIKDQVIELQRKGVDLAEYTVVGPDVVLANFEGELKADGTRSRVQPRWDKGYTIDIFYVSYFLIAMFIVIKRLPHYSWQPDYSDDK
ncbi:hypothetical protein Tel_00450 [Candidatus Tenderia electrophaga]|jgi:hypothetical protein|uniref:Uncharacterized protein n=1 Tax=Candidatus Tenderia electrophaga TaxID=1748243 RepID=A0A0S2T9C9_9GAMM|nr:hypothetical protein Tel_00450 [Candidatus Tenderia electrophaga]